MQAKKHFGQNFLKDHNIIKRIVDAANLSPEETVLEIGPGLGALTAEIAPHVKKLICVEKDFSLKDYLQKEFAPFSNIEFRFEDFLKTDLQKIPIFKVIGNIPYNISTPIVFKLLDHRSHITSAVLTVQKEVAERLAASPGSKAYGIPSVLLQAHAQVDALFDIKPGSFLPPPAVMSTTIRISFLPSPRVPMHHHPSWVKLVKTSFGKRRKTLQNNLKELYPIDVLKSACIQCDIHLSSRAEELSVEQYTKLANCLHDLL